MQNKPWYYSRTLWLAIVQGIAGIVMVVATQYPTMGDILILKSIVDMILRVLTTQPVTIS